MKDHTMCVKASCAARKSCARYTADPERGQALYHPDPKLNKHGSCEKFIANDELKGAVLAKSPDKWAKRGEFLAHTHKYHTTQHREDSIARGKLPLPICVDGVKIPAAKQVEFFERKLKEARFKEYGHQLTRSMEMLDASNITPPKYSDSHAEFADAFNAGAIRFVERGHCTRMASDHTVAIHSAEAVRGHIHIVVMAQDDNVAVRELFHEVNELTQAKY